MSVTCVSSAEVLARMRAHFGHQVFRAGQEQIVGAVLGGRDGRPATATLLWHYGDVATREFLIDSPRRDQPGRPPAVDPEEARRRKDLEHRKLERMVDYAETDACLRATILRYFGDAAAHEPCDACGNCRPNAIDAYERELLRKILAGIARSGERYGRARIVAMLRGDVDDLPAALTRLTTTGLLKQQPADTLHGWLDAAITAGLVAVSKNQYRTLSLTGRGGDFMRGRGAPPEIRRPGRAVMGFTPPRDTLMA